MKNTLLFRKSSFLLYWSFAILFLLNTQVSRGQLLTEDFTGTVGTALTANGWTLHSGTATPFLISSPGLTYTTYLSNGVGNAASTGGTSDDINKVFTSTNTGSLYMSFMYKPTSASLTTDYSVMFGATSGASVTGFYGKLYVQRDASNNVRFGITKNTAASANYTGYTYSLNTTYLIVIRYDFVASTANDVAQLFINPIVGASEPLATVIGLADAAADPAQLTSVALRQATTTAAAVYDGIRVGTTWGSVTPSGAPAVSLGVTSNSASETSPASITVTATASAAVTGNQTVTLTPTGTATSGSDYTLGSTTITILNGQTTGTTTFIAIDDAAIEGSETAILTITGTSSGLSNGTPLAQTITIADNDFPTVNLAVTSNSASETAPASITVTATASQAVVGNQTVTLTPTGTATSGSDYTLGSTTITILNGQTTGTTTFIAIDDASIEGSETATLTITSTSGGLSNGTPLAQTITITDNDFPTVALSVSSNSSSEASPSDITVTATASQAVVGDQTVALGVSGTNITAGDYTLGNTTITILSGQTTGSTTFTVVDDAAIESTETAVLTISSPSAGLTLGSPLTQNIVITDNDVASTPVVTLSVDTNSGTEAGVTVVTVTATADTAVTGNQTVDLAVTGTNITGGDYTLGSSTITILNGATTGSTTFTVVDDALIEGSETATLTISNPSAGLTLGGTTTQDVAITDNDFPTVALSVSSNSSSEASPSAIMVTATASQAVVGNQTVTLGVSGTGITAGDYSLGSTTITILNGQFSGSTTFTVVNDVAVEGTETATLTISAPSAGLTLGTPTTQNITITDNDFPTVALSVSANAGTETAATVITVTATASQAVSGNQTVTLGVSGTNVTAGDYTLGSATITILNGQTTGTTTFTVVDDLLVEASETAVLTISSPSAGITLGTPVTQNVVITDNDVAKVVTLSVSANAGTEVGATVITVTANASGAVAGNQTVALGVSGTNITAGDYTLGSSTITILDGASTGSTTFTIVDDGVIEGTETATLTISSPSLGLSLGSPVSQNITITEIDTPVATAATNPTATSFDANWATVTGADGYRLDVSTNILFGINTVGTVVGWNFQASSVTASSGIAANSAKVLSTGGGTSAITFTNVSSSITGRAATWDSGSGTKYWEVAAISTVGYSSLTISSKQRSSSTGPRDFKLQYKVGAGTYADVPSGTITTADNLTTGVLTNVALPAACDNQASISLRWIMTSNTSVGNATVAATGASNIDDIIISGTTVTPSFVTGYNNLTVSGGGTNTSPVNTNLSPSTTYYYRVRAHSTNSTSASSNTITVTTCASAPTITNSYCAGATTVTGTSLEAVGTVIRVYKGITLISSGTDTVLANGTWSAVVPALDSGDSLTATAQVGTNCVSVASNVKVVNATPTTSAISGLSTVCANATAVAYSVTNTSGSSYAWTITNGTQASGTNTNSITVNWASGSGNVSVVETSAAGCAGAVVDHAVTINPLPTVSIDTDNGAPTTIGIGGTTYLIPTSGGIWVSNSPSIATVANDGTVTAGTTNGGPVNFTFTDDATGCSATTDDVTVNASATFSTIEVDALSCVTTSDFRVTGLTPLINTTIYYTLGGGAEQSTIVSPNTSISHVFINLTSANDGQHLIVTKVKFTDYPTSPIVTVPDNANSNLTLQLGPSLSISGPISPACGATTANLTSVVTSDGITVEYFSDAYVTAVPDPTSVSVAGTYYVRATSSTIGDCTKDATITVNAFKANPTTSAISGSNSVCSNISGVAYSVTNTAGSSYVWTITGGSQASGTTTNSITVNWGAAGSGNVSVVETNAAGCVGTTVNRAVTIVTNLTWYRDVDHDGYGNALISQSNCVDPSTLGVYWVVNSTDCNDADVNINPGVTEICYNNIDDNCDGNKSEGCAAVVVNMTPSLNGSTLTSFTPSLTAVPYVYAGATSIGYRFWIKNMTTLEEREILSATRFVQIPTDMRAYSTQYELKVSAIINGEIVAYAGNTVTVTSQSIPTTQLTSAYCNTTLASISATISANPGLNATSYTFRIRKTSDNGPTPNYGITSPQASRYVSAGSIGLALEFGTSYTVTVKYTMLNNGVTVESAYGSECTITTPSIPVVGLTSPICGTRLSSISTTISASPASSPVHYMFRVRLTSDVSPTPTYGTILSTSRFAQLPSLTGLALTYDTSYTISVRYSVMYNGNEVYSGYGSECEVITPIASTTELQPSQCGEEATEVLPATPYAVPSYTTPIYAVAVSGVSYVFQLQKLINGVPVGVPFEITRVLNWFALNLIPGITAGEYTVTVITRTPYGDGYGKDCTITVPAPARETADDIANVKVTFSAVAYPNPFANNFVIDVKTRSESAVTLKVYDMIGRLVDQKEVKVSDLQSSPVGDNYPSGVYNVIVTQGDEVRTVRVVKR